MPAQVLCIHLNDIWRCCIIRSDIALLCGQVQSTGQCNVKTYNRRLMNLIRAGRAEPSKIISHRLPLEEAPNAFKHFNARDDGWTKVVLKP